MYLLVQRKKLECAMSGFIICSTIVWYRKDVFDILYQLVLKSIVIKLKCFDDIVFGEKKHWLLNFIYFSLKDNAKFGVSSNIDTDIMWSV